MRARQPLTLILLPARGSWPRLLFHSPFMLYRNRPHLQADIPQTAKPLKRLRRLGNGGPVPDLLGPQPRLGRVVVELLEVAVADISRQRVGGRGRERRRAVGRVLAPEEGPQDDHAGECDRDAGF